MKIEGGRVGDQNKPIDKRITVMVGKGRRREHKRRTER
jgi:hypothetical protein